MSDNREPEDVIWQVLRSLDNRGTLTDDMQAALDARARMITSALRNAGFTIERSAASGGDPGLSGDDLDMAYARRHYQGGPLL